MASRCDGGLVSAGNGCFAAKKPSEIINMIHNTKTATIPARQMVRRVLWPGCERERALLLLHVVFCTRYFVFGT